MEQREKIEGSGKRIWRLLLAAALAAYTIKNIFVGADVDEGYGIVLGYRLAVGDRLLLEMWEPHQTSAIFTALFIKPFLWLTGGTEWLNLYLRAAYFAVQALIGRRVCRTLRDCLPELGRESAALLAMCWYLVTPKCICIPEYSNLHMWFFTLLCLQLLRYFCPDSPKRGRAGTLAAAGVFLACDVLAYPSMAILFPVCLGILLRNPVRGRLRECALFAAPCILGACAFVFWILTYLTPVQIGGLLPYILGDGSHQLSVGEKLSLWGESLAGVAAVLALGGLLSWLISRIFRRVDFWFCFYLVQLCGQLAYWLAGRRNASYLQVVFAASLLIGVRCYFLGGRREKAGFGLILFSVVSYLGVVLLSNWSPMYLKPYLLMGVIGAWICWARACDPGEGERLLRKVCVLFLLFYSFGYCYRIIGSDNAPGTLLDVRGINRGGFRKGILTSYMTAYRYNQNREIWPEAVPDGSTVLYVGQSQFFYLLGDCTIASPSTISTPSYDESLLAYWEQNPDRYPDVVAVESWFGDLRVLEEDGFLDRWLRQDFRASRVEDYPYITVYYK